MFSSPQLPKNNALLIFSPSLYQMGQPFSDFALYSDTLSLHSHKWVDAKEDQSKPEQ